MAATSLLEELEDTHGDAPTIPHAHAAPSEWERHVAKMHIAAMRLTLAQKTPPEPKTVPGRTDPH